MVSAAHLAVVEHFSLHRNNSLRGPCALVDPVVFALHLKENGGMFAEKKKGLTISSSGL